MVTDSGCDVEVGDEVGEVSGVGVDADGEGEGEEVGE
jgi:hypothetical protein